MFIIKAVVLQLKIEVTRAKNIPIAERRILGVLIIPAKYRPGYLPRNASGQGDNTLVVLLHQLEINARPIIEALYPALRDHSNKVSVACLIFAQQHQVAVLPVEFADLIKACALCHIYLTADNWLYPALLRGFIEVDDTVHITVVCNGYHDLPKFLHPVQKTFDAAGPIQKAVLRMHVQVRKRHCIPLPSALLT